MVSYHIIYFGRVQGVGFRWTSSNIAKEYGVNGSVKNLADGSVELYIQGQEEQVDAVLKKIEEIMGKNITSVDKSKSDLRNFTSFDVLL
ncbi:MAG: acylphosphatase [Zetaproteobacteria bacterium]|nr:acylphosphatase [Pseudobdellovibrionaceae bacterium]|tara:strand:+ start:1443 stop:1709 length:267 start_codon:yes stop_codon:yes gene_type:complete